MFDIEDFENDFVPEKTKERILKLDKNQQEKFVKSLGKRISDKYNKLLKKEQLDLNKIDELITQSTEEILDEIEGQPIDNWKNGLDLL